MTPPISPSTLTTSLLHRNPSQRTPPAQSSTRSSRLPRSSLCRRSSSPSRASSHPKAPRRPSAAARALPHAPPRQGKKLALRLWTASHCCCRTISRSRMRTLNLRRKSSGRHHSTSSSLSAHMRSTSSCPSTHRLRPDAPRAVPSRRARCRPLSQPRPRCPRWTLAPLRTRRLLEARRPGRRMRGPSRTTGRSARRRCMECWRAHSPSRMGWPSRTIPWWHAPPPRTSAGLWPAAFRSSCFSPPTA
mmetsp:Transcript_22567/g.72975  ORF Transcript_22567/g.72975 Transcript_22567/m.72975 type:complete len:246 (-) Transcript_22567:563-1300(-)